MTAITTAGLLAGLFGSAFVPTASALRTGGTLDTPVASRTNVVYQDTTWYSTYSDPGPVLGTDYDVSEVDYWPSAAGAHRFTIPSFGVQTAWGADRDYEDGSNDLSIGFELMGRLGEGPITVADLTATSSDKSIEIAWAYLEDEATEAASCSDSDILDLYGLSDSVEGVHGVDGLMDAYSAASGNGRTYILCYRPLDNSKPGTSTITVNANGVKVATVTIRSLGDLDSLTLSNATGYANVAESNNNIRHFFKIVGKDSAGQVINDTYTSQSPYDLEDWTGHSIEQLGYDDDEEIENEQGDVIDFMGPYNDDNATTATGADNYSYNRIGLKHDVCVPETNTGAGDGSAGNSYALGFELENADGDVIPSNTVSILCTGNLDEYTVKSLSIEYASGDADWAASDVAEDDLDGVIGIYATIVDSAGRPMGANGRVFSDGGNDHTLGFTLEGTALSDMNLEDWDDYTSGEGYSFGRTNGVKTLIGFVVPDLTGQVKREISFVVEDWDANYEGTAALADLERSLFYTVTGFEAEFEMTRVRNAAKTSATWTVDFGLECSSQFVYFDWENADGTKGTTVTGNELRRRANIDGIAKLTLNKRNMVVFVTAYSCDDLESGGIEVGPVKARFR